MGTVGNTNSCPLGRPSHGELLHAISGLRDGGDL
jgi:hypothetical protein